jgi:8-oxo-dGTP pyrophosphatase MutT (NUDIX family)
MSEMHETDPDLPPWTAGPERTVLQDRWVHVTAEDCVTATGASVAPFYLYNFPDFCHAAAVTETGKLVLVRQYRHGARRVSLELPGGAVDAGETPEAAAARELLEETGYAGTVQPTLVSGWANPVNLRNRLHLVLITGARRIADPRPEPTEQLIVEEVSWPDLPARIQTGEVAHPMHLASILQLSLKAGGEPFARLGARLPAAWSQS